MFVTERLSGLLGGIDCSIALSDIKRDDISNMKMKVKFHQWCWGILAWLALIGCANSYEDTNVEITPRVTNLETETVDPRTDLKLKDDSTDDIVEDDNRYTDSIGEVADAWIERFRKCMSVRGYHIQNFTSEIADSMDDTAFRRAVDLCGIETDAISISQELLKWYSESVENMTPSQIQVENTITASIAKCVEKQGWEMKLVTEDNGLLIIDQQYLDDYYNAMNPKVFSMLASDMNTCISEVGMRE